MDKPDTEAIKREKAKERAADIANMNDAVQRLDTAEKIKTNKDQEEFQATTEYKSKLELEKVRADTAIK